jgi:hypothetical protein
VYGETMLRTAGPERMRHLDQAQTCQDHLPALSARYRAEHLESSRG